MKKLVIEQHSITDMDALERYLRNDGVAVARMIREFELKVLLPVSGSGRVAALACDSELKAGERPG